ncbi:DMT family transporter [Paracoccus sp. (in: a-proteobacteria)]|uniref:DMT family transporter n=1 Tax=Paracoccus sp. TaxID=267 RepID=UPI0035B32E17
MTRIATFPSPTLPRSRAAFALSTLAALFWGTNFEATRIVLEGMDPWTAAATRFVIATAAIMLWLGMSGGFDVASLRRNLIAFCVLGIIGVAGFNAALFLGMRSSSPVTAALIMATSPLTTTLLDAFLQGRRPSTRAMLGMAIALFGVAITVGAFAGTRIASGDLLILCGSLGWAIYTIGCRHWVRGADALQTASWTMLSGTVVLVILALWLGDPLDGIAHAGGRIWATILWMALFGSALAYIFWQVGVSVRGAGPTSVLFNLVPVAALILAAILGRMPQPMQVAGVAIAILGVVLASGRPAARGRAGWFRHGFAGDAAALSLDDSRRNDRPRNP